MTTTRIDEIADGIYRVSTALAALPGGFTFNQFLIADEDPLLYHTGPRRLLAETRKALERVLPVTNLRWIAFSHFEADECGALNELLALAPRAEPLCGAVAKMTSVDDQATRPARALADGEELALGRHRVRWHDTPHLPHAWECGHLSETSTRTLFCGDLFTQGGAEHPPLTESDILGPSEGMRKAFDYWAHTRELPAQLERLARTEPTTLACMHGASFRGDGATLLRELGRVLAARA
ncbi:MAG TPA: MBL fold metallo-hydrolase [Planctomycetota bacterium]